MTETFQEDCVGESCVTLLAGVTRPTGGATKVQALDLRHCVIEVLNLDGVHSLKVIPEADFSVS